jgi:glycosyltransferase involved in cell wall biosynthesis
MSQQPKLLSICVPVYGRELFIGTLLKSIPDAYLDKIEVCISENPYHDNTSGVIKEHSSRFPHFKYEKRDKNYGFDNNLLHVVEMASGKYCWTLGSDDWVTENALDIIFKILETEKPSILIGNNIGISVDKSWKKKNFWLPPQINSYSFKFNETDKINEYFCLSQNISAVGGFISSNIFERELWLNTKINSTIATSYIHLNKIISMIFSPANKGFLYIKDHIVYATIENDAVFSNAWNPKHRLFVDLRASTELADEYIKEPRLCCEFIKILCRLHPFLDLYRIAVIPDCDKEEMRLLKRIFPLWQIFICRHLGYRRGGYIHKTLKSLKKTILSLLK